MAGLSGVRPYLMLDDFAGTVAFYKNAFGAKVALEFPMPGSSVPVHAELAFPHKNGRFFVAPAMGDKKGHKALGNSPVSLWFTVPDCDKAFTQAVKAGAKVVSEPETMYWGDRSASVLDPEGNRWSLMTRVKKMSDKQMLKANDDCFAGNIPFSTDKGVGAASKAPKKKAKATKKKAAAKVKATKGKKAAAMKAGKPKAAKAKKVTKSKKTTTNAKKK
eukprot:CAMPEP_0174845732 /NCGR_PEP_ID=MMETSP1114-20130205/11903_1 /TAXON_ID=312471 /ORGANISM="Neobodo designis, Strain CCAP 1951/1" /LENGTH=217 /DNA_ID=CAMNT_0016079987 /DNA_START=42 /DNA_END=695 /DNA_ORIENTATION=+